MRIIFFSDHFRPEPSAPAAHVYERSLHWVRDGHEVTVVTSAPNFPEGKVYPGYRNRVRAIEEMDGIRVVRVGTFITRNEGFALRTLDYASYMVSSFLLAQIERRPDVVISTSPHLFAAMAGTTYARARRVPHVVEIRDLWPASIRSTVSLRGERLYNALEGIELGIYRRSARIISLTHSFVGDMTRRGVPEEKIDVVINGANLELFSPRERDAEIEERYGLRGRFVIGYLGTIGLAHGLENVIAAAELLRDTPITFLFVGVGAAKEALERAVAERTLENVVFAPRQLKEDMPRFWSVCDAGLIHLKDDELFATVIPSKIFESMAMGLPVLYAGPRGEGTGIVERHEAGLCVSSSAPRELANAARRLAGDSELRERLAANSLAAAPEYSRTRHARATMASLERAQDGR